ncbi:hypothetical protein ElyMa_006259600 [Elysia marginata]|uniref:Apple domain-containing protein n=1 Tax=Elysia marginata TaxID=1093978 RepID=A0AAV4HCR3_9GAST|nr:hypothetical protein ElyMa_006259600 [Elysia marginata]
MKRSVNILVTRADTDTHLHIGTTESPPLSDAITTNSRIECGLRCTSSHSRCTAYRYNASSGACLTTLSYQHLPAVGLEAANDSEIYVACDLSQGFKIYRHGGATMCLRCTRKSMAYLEAKQACQDIESSVVSLESQVQLDLLLLAMAGTGINRSWIGQNPTLPTLKFRVTNKAKNFKCLIINKKKQIKIRKKKCMEKSTICCEM